MIRMLCVIVVAVAGLTCVPMIGAGQTLQPGKDYELEIGGKLTSPGLIAPALDDVVHGYRFLQGFGTVLPIELKAGQPLTISATVVGEDRKVFVVLIDPTGKFVKGAEFKEKTTQVEVKEVSAKGRYGVVVFSDMIGPFTLRADGPTTSELDKQLIKEKIDKLKKELADLEAKYKALEEKETPKPAKPPK